MSETNGERVAPGSDATNMERDADGVNGGADDNSNPMKDYSYLKFVGDHSSQLEASGVPHSLWPALYEKISKEVFDAGDVFYMLQETAGSSGDSDKPGPVGGRASSLSVWVSKDDGVQPDDPDSVYLIDHAWTYRGLRTAKHQLTNIPALAQRMAKLMGIAGTDSERRASGDLVDDVLREMWRYAQTYRVNVPGVSTAESMLPVWYVMDEFGSAIPHSETPSCRVVPLYCIPQQTTYSILFPIRRLEAGDEVTRNYVEYLRSDGSCYLDGDITNRQQLVAKCCLLPWLPVDVTGLTSHIHDPRWLGHVAYFQSGRESESVPVQCEDGGCRRRGGEGKWPMKVYSQYEYVTDYLTDRTHFTLVDKMQDADILWLTSHFKDYKELSEDFPDKFINQFPFENVVTIKDLMSVVARRAAAGKPGTDTDQLDLAPDWLPATYNLTNELPEFVANYQKREKAGMDNHWILKPWNLARGLDIHITDNLSQIIRLRETGPMVVSKYIERPVLFQRDDVPGGGVKFDLRYIVLLKSVRPLTLYVYDKFWLRFANKPFSLQDLSDSDTHLTVMNYKPDAAEVMKNMRCEEFIPRFERQYAGVSWREDVERAEVYRGIRELFAGAAACQAVPPPCGMAASPQSRAVYGVDVMLRWADRADRAVDQSRVQAQILEVNFMPDCQRACHFYPHFYNHVFLKLFSEDEEDAETKGLPITQLV